jgi:hypothetical protein
VRELLPTAARANILEREIAHLFKNEGREMVRRRAVIVAAFLAAALGTSVTAAIADPTGGAGAPAAVKAPKPLAIAGIRQEGTKPNFGATYRIRVVRGDARGVRARSVGSVDLPSVINPLDYDNFFTFQAAYATFVPRGLAYFATYYGRKGTRVLAGVLPLR